jgi:hypothetical protein
MKSLNFSEKEFKKPQNRSKYLKLQEKPHITLKNFSISLKLPPKRIEIFTKALIFLKISLNCHEFLNTKKPRKNCPIATMANPPLIMGVPNRIDIEEAIKNNPKRSELAIHRS